jgi:hypothetical protein
MKSLKTQIKGLGEVRGFIFTQISKTDGAFLYEVNTGNQIHYEVFKKRVNTRYGCISYPTSKAFGIWAFTKGQFCSAVELFNQLNSDD